MENYDDEIENQRPFGREVADETRDVPELGETEFEKARGINRIDIREGYVGALVINLGDPVMESRLAVLKCVKEKGISMDFLKFTRDGLSFLIKEADFQAAKEAFEMAGVEYVLRPDESLLVVHAVNMRDEEGLVARIVSEVIATGERIDHMGDMHDRLMMVMSREDAIKAKRSLENKFVEVLG